MAQEGARTLERLPVESPAAVLPRWGASLGSGAAEASRRRLHALVRRGCGQGIRLDENVCRNPEPCMETSDHPQGQGAFPVEHFRYPCTASQVGFQVAAAEPMTVHVVGDRFDGVWRGKAAVLLFVSFHKRG